MITTSTKAREMVDAMKDAAPAPRPQTLDEQIIDVMAQPDPEGISSAFDKYRRDAAARVLARLRGKGFEVAPRAAWLPIETAPRIEGKWIFACRAGTVVPMVTGWDDEEQRWFTFNLVFETAKRREPGWLWEPTHWHPWPDIPAK